MDHLGNTVPGKICKGWERHLAPPIALSGSPIERIATLKDAADFLGQYIDQDGSDELYSVQDALITAAESGLDGDVQLATKRLLALLQERGWAKPSDSS